MIFNVLGGLAGQIIGLFGAAGQQKREALNARIQNMQRSWTDEILVLYWFSPSFVAWVNPDKATTMIQAMTADKEFFAVQAAITAAVFGLGKLNGRVTK